MHEPSLLGLCGSQQGPWVAQHHCGELGGFMFPASLARGGLKLVCGLRDLFSTLLESL